MRANDAAGKIVRVKATAGARREAVQLEGGVYRISVKEKAEHNYANERIKAVLARELSLPERAIRLIAGQRSQAKKFLVRGSTEDRQIS